jgi:hypothetical protein
MRDKFDEEMDRRIKLTDQLAADIIKNSELLDQHLKPCGDDLILLTLKGHLIIEGLLEINLSRLLAIDHLPKENEDGYPGLEFIHKLKLLQAALVESKPGPNTDLFKAIAKLNSIRNKLAHNLKNSPEIEADVKAIIDCYQSKADKKLKLGESPAEQLRNCIRKLCGFLCRVRVHFFKLEIPSDK